MRANTFQPGSGKKDLNRLPYLAERCCDSISTVNSTYSGRKSARTAKPGAVRSLWQGTLIFRCPRVDEGWKSYE